MTVKHYVAIDTETTLFPDRRTVRCGSTEVRIDPFVVPDLRFITAACPGAEVLIAGVDDIQARDAIMRLIVNQHVDLVFQNAPFDVFVLLKAFPTLRPMFAERLERGTIHDTKVMDVLLRLKDGYFDKLNPVSLEMPAVVSRSLKDLAEAYLGEDISKDVAVRCNFGQFRKVEELPAEFADYAKKDADVTLRVWERMLDLSQGALLSEPIQTAASVAIYEMDLKGVAIDSAEARRLKELFEADLPELERKMYETMLGEYKRVGGTSRLVTVAPLAGAKPTDGPWYFRPDLNVMEKTLKNGEVWHATAHFSTNQGMVRAMIERDAVPRLNGTPFKRTEKTGLMQLDADFWADYIPADSPLQLWLQRQKLTKIIGTYLALYSQVERIYPKWNTLGARSGRMSCACPNVQNVPKRKHGIRSLFVAEPGKVFVKADYSTQELLTLAEAMLGLGIKGPLLKAIQDGVDLHKNTVSLMFGTPIEQVTKADRQAAKAYNFGIPGGLGPRKLADYAKAEYKVDLTPEQAKEMRQRFLAAYTDIRDYLKRLNVPLARTIREKTGRSFEQWCGDLGLDPHATGPREFKEACMKHSVAYRMLMLDLERSQTVVLPSGRVRRGCTFTEAANTYFQGLASDVTKMAVILAWGRGLDVRLIVHDEIVVQCPPEYAADTGLVLEDCMKQAFVRVCPTVGPYAKVEVDVGLARWGNATNKIGDAI